MKYSILHEAYELITGDRHNAYGDARDDFARQAQLWSAILGAEVTASQVAMCMIATKIAREANKPKRDNRLDMIGYAALLDYVTGPDA